MNRWWAWDHTLPEIDDDLLALASDEEKLAYVRAMELKLALHSPLDFADYVTPTNERYLHAEYLNTHLVALVEHRLYADGPGPEPIEDEEGRLVHPERGDRVKTRLAVTEPPRHGKSYLVSDHMPAWFLSRYPKLVAAVVSYEADFAAEWGGKARKHLLEHPELCPLNDKTTAARKWYTAAGGRMFTSGAQGAITGKGVHILVYDDAIKNYEEAASDIIRENAWNNFQTAIETRLEPGAVIVLMMTRWNADDIMGRATGGEYGDPDEWFVLRLPALAEEGDPLGRLPGEALCPSRYTKVELEDTRVRLGPLKFAAMYQGSPYVQGGGIFSQDDFRYFQQNPSYFILLQDGGAQKYVRKTDCVRFQTLDLNASLKTSADWTVLSTWDVTPDHELLLVDRLRLRLEEPDHGPFVVKHYERLKPRWLLIGDKTFGSSLIKGIQRGVYGPRIIARPYAEETDKYARAIPAGAYMHTHRVFWPQNAPWLMEWEQELLQFPNATHDDQVDTFSAAAWEITLGAMGIIRQLQKQHDNRGGTAEDRAQRHLKAVEKRTQKSRRHPILGGW